MWIHWKSALDRYEVRYQEEHHVISGADRFFAQVVSSSANMRGLTQHITAD